ncbi:MAG TPA: hypothetical protein VH370_21385 [Humisphaera sp.]|jgi:hypothetical protein|nr:hypothetical protein [Humisphaera sp.]
MGLDTVAIIMAVEDEFAISIADKDAEKAQTIGQTIDLIVSMLNSGPRPDPSHCASARTFYHVRRELVSEYGIAREAIRPDSLVGQLILPGPHRRVWRDIARRCGLPIPRFNPLKPLAPRFPKAKTTLRQLIESRSLVRYFHMDGSVNVEAVTRRVHQIVGEQTGVSQDKLGPGTHYIDDLNMD